MRTARLALLGFALALLAACGASNPTAPANEGGSESVKTQRCGYLGSAGRC